MLTESAHFPEIVLCFFASDRTAWVPPEKPHHTKTPDFSPAIKMTSNRFSEVSHCDSGGTVMKKQTRPRSVKTQQQHLPADQEPLFPEAEREIAARSRKPSRRQRPSRPRVQRQHRLIYDDDLERFTWELETGYRPRKPGGRYADQFRITFNVAREKHTRISVLVARFRWKNAA
jgi:hypothetical protein